MRGSRIAIVLTVLAGLSAGNLLTAADAPKSGPQVGDRLPGPFQPLNINGEKANEKSCLVCENGPNPVAMIFARQPSATLTSLIKKLDAATEKNKEHSMGSFVVFLSDDADLEKALKKCVEECKLKHTVLAIDNPSGPKGYEIAADADVTVVLYTKQTVKANYVFKKDALKDKDIETIIADLKKILPEKK